MNSGHMNEKFTDSFMAIGTFVQGIMKGFSNVIAQLRFASSFMTINQMRNKNSCKTNVLYYTPPFKQQQQNTH